MEPFSKDLPLTTVAADEVLIPQNSYYFIVLPTHLEAERAPAPRRGASSASTRVSRSQPKLEGTVSKVSASSRADLVDAVSTAPSCRPLRHSSGKAETPAETIALRRADDTELYDSAARQAALPTLQGLRRLDGLSPQRTGQDVAVQAREWLAAMAHVGRLRAERNASEAIQEAS